MRKVTIGALAAILVVLLVVAAVGSGGKNGGRHPPAPALPTQVLVSPRVDLAALRGRPAFVNFWASWCGPCIHETPELERFSHLVAGRAAVVGIDWEDDAASARGFIRRHALSYPILRDGSGEIGNRFGLVGLPTTFVLDRNGRVALKLLGPQRVATLERALKRVER